MERLADCRVCHTQMNPVLPKGGLTAHPCCDPDEVPWARSAAARSVEQLELDSRDF